MFTKTKIAGGVLAALSLPFALPASADTIFTDFDQDGTFVATDSLDWAPGNALAVNAVPLAPGGTFTTYITAELTEVVGGGTSYNIPIGNAGPYEITYVIALNETINYAFDTDGDTIPDVVGFNHTGGTVQVYYDDFSGGTVNADPYGNSNSGLGYDDGTLILSGDIVPVLLGATFSLTNGSAQNNIQLLDQFSTDNLGGVLTVTGSGNATVQAQNLVYDTAFFDGVNIYTIVEFLLNATLEDPFDGNNPELLVAGNAPVYGANNINGIFGGVGTESFHFEADANSSFKIERIPEPATIALMGIGLALIGGAKRRSRKAA